MDSSEVNFSIKNDPSKGRTLTGRSYTSEVKEVHTSEVNQALKGPTLLGVFGLSNQPKSPIYLFRQSQCQIANLPSIL